MNSGGWHLQGWTAWRVLGAATLAALALFAVGQRVDRASAGGKCAHADATIDEASGKQLRKAIICLVNNDRADRDRHVLDPNSKLLEAANKHNKAMKRENCWKHECPGEPSLGKRIRNTGYLDGARRWRYAESFGCSATPNGMMNAWLGDDFTRENLRNRAFRDIGVGVLKDQIGASSCDDGDEVTYTAVLARRKG
jgi:uncharacterized protein YkwD